MAFPLGSSLREFVARNPIRKLVRKLRFSVRKLALPNTPRPVRQASAEVRPYGFCP